MLEKQKLVVVKRKYFEKLSTDLSKIFDWFFHEKLLFFAPGFSLPALRLIRITLLTEKKDK